MNRASLEKPLSTGIDSLDNLIQGVHWGESMLFHVGEPSEALSFLRPLLDFVETNGLPAYSVSFSGNSIFDNMDFPALQRITPRPMEPLEDFRCQFSNLAARDERPYGIYVFEDLASLAKRLPHEHEILQTVTWIHNLIHEKKRFACFLLTRGSFSNFILGQLKETVSIFLDIWTQDSTLYFQPIKVKGCYSSQLYVPYRFDGKTVQSASEIHEYVQALEQQSKEFLQLYSEKKSIEAELARKDFELSLINNVSTSLLSTMNLDEILYRILVGVTANEGLGFNRAFLLLVNDQTRTLEGKFAIGPSNLHEAMQIWDDIRERHWTFPDLLAAFDMSWETRDVHVNKIVKGIRVPLDQRSHILIDLLMQTQPEIISGADSKDPTDSQKLLDLFEVECLAAVPLWYNQQPLGLLIADNLITGKPISGEDLRLLETFANYAANAIKDSLLYEEVQRRIQENERHITELEAMQDRLIRSKRLSDLGELASKVAHEIRTPLVSIGGFAHAILKRHGPDSPDYEELKIIVEEVRRLEKILRNVLTYVSPGIPRTEPTDLAAVANRTLRLFRPTLKGKGIRCSTRFSENLPEVEIDPEQIALVLTAVVSNAVEAMPNGGSLTLGLEHSQEFLQLSISDTGGGIPEADMSKVFDAFFTTKSLGSGLGLNIASQIIANHKGSIYLESKVGVGSTFLINFPRAKVRETSHEHLVNRG